MGNCGFIYIVRGGSIASDIIIFKRQKEKYFVFKKAWKTFENILPQFLAVLLLVGVLLAVLDAEAITKVIGAESGWLGVLFSAVVGAITLIPGFVAFPMAAMLLKGGAGYMQIGAFVSALMMVGVVTLPVEFKYFGRKLAVLRNLLAFVFPFLSR